MNKKVIDKNLAYCGIYCPKCYRMKVSGAASRLIQELTAAQLKGATYLDDAGKDCKSFLNHLIQRRCNKFCRAGGGESCKIKQCCLDKNLDGCWECAKFETCNILSDQFIDNCKKIKKIGVDEYMKECRK